MFFSIKYRYRDILLKKKHKLHSSRLFCCNYTCYCVNMASVTSVSCCITSASCYIMSASWYHLCYQSRSSMYICGLIPRNFPELGETVPIDALCLQKIPLPPPKKNRNVSLTSDNDQILIDRVCQTVLKGYHKGLYLGPFYLMFSINNIFTLSWEVPYIYADNYADDNTLSFHFHNYNELISTLHSDRYVLF